MRIKSWIKIFVSPLKIKCSAWFTSQMNISMSLIIMAPKGEPNHIKINVCYLFLNFIENKKEEINKIKPNYKSVVHINQN